MPTFFEYYIVGDRPYGVGMVGRMFHFRGGGDVRGMDEDGVPDHLMSTVDAPKNIAASTPGSYGLDRTPPRFIELTLSFHFDFSLIISVVVPENTTSYELTNSGTTRSVLETSFDYRSAPLESIELLSSSLEDDKGTMMAMMRTVNVNESTLTTNRSIQVNVVPPQPPTDPTSAGPSSPPLPSSDPAAPIPPTIMVYFSLFFLIIRKYCVYLLTLRLGHQELRPFRSRLREGQNHIP